MWQVSYCTIQRAYNIAADQTAVEEPQEAPPFIVIQSGKSVGRLIGSGQVRPGQVRSTSQPACQPASQQASQLLIHCLLLLPLFVGFCVWSLFCNAVISVLSCYSIILMRKSELISYFVFFLLCFCLWLVPLPHITIGWSVVCDCGIPDHSHTLIAHTVKPV